MSGLRSCAQWVLKQTIQVSLLLTLIVINGKAEAAPGIDSPLVRPANADTVFDYVLVFPADADDQVLEAWRQRALDLARDGAAGARDCNPQVVRFYVAASWQLPMLGLRCGQGELSIPAQVLTRATHAAEAKAPVWMAKTSINSVRGQVAAMLQ